MVLFEPWAVIMSCQVFFLFDAVLELSAIPVPAPVPAAIHGVLGYAHYYKLRLLRRCNLERRMS